MGFARGETMTVSTAFRLGQIWYADRLREDWEPRSRETMARLLSEVGLEGEFWDVS